MSGLEKNVASQKWRVFAFNVTDGTAKTGDLGQITAKIAKDWGALAALTDVSPVEQEDGYYLFDLTQAETNAKVLDLYPESSTANIQVVGVPGTIFPVAVNFSDLGVESDGDLTKVNTLDGQTAQTGDSFARLGAPVGASHAADILTIDNFIDTEVAAILVDTAEIGAAGAGLSNIPTQDANMIQIEGSANRVSKLAEGLDNTLHGDVVSATDATKFVIQLLDGDTVDATADTYNGRFLTFTNGANIHQGGKITDSISVAGEIIVASGTFTTTPVAGDDFVIT